METRFLLAICQMIGFSKELGVFLVDSLFVLLLVCVVFLVVCFIILQLLL